MEQWKISTPFFLIFPSILNVTASRIDNLQNIRVSLNITAMPPLGRTYTLSDGQCQIFTAIILPTWFSKIQFSSPAALLIAMDRPTGDEDAPMARNGVKCLETPKLRN